MSCDSAGYDAHAQLRRDLAAGGRVSQRALVICAGEGTTATRTVAIVLKKLQLATMHCDECGHEPPPAAHLLTTSC